MSSKASTEYGKGLQYGFDIFPFWNNLNDKVAYERMFAEGRPEKMREAQAMISQNPLTSNAEIRHNMTVHSVPPKSGYLTRELTIDDVLNHDFPLSHTNINHSLWNDFSGSDGETNSTERPYTPSVW